MNARAVLLQTQLDKRNRMTVPTGTSESGLSVEEKLNLGRGTTAMTDIFPCPANPSTGLVHVGASCECFIGGPRPLYFQEREMTSGHHREDS